jgi:hypothetical protein
MRRVSLALLLTLGLASCGSRTAVPVEPPPASPIAARNGLEVSLLWNAPVDLDVYLTDPTWETLYFANNPTRGGGKIERDTRCVVPPATPPFVERAHVDEVKPGPYRIGVHFIDACGSDVGEASFRLVVDLEGKRFERVGSVRRDEFRVVALEFEVRDEGAGRELYLGGETNPAP